MATNTHDNTYTSSEETGRKTYDGKLNFTPFANQSVGVVAGRNERFAEGHDIYDDLSSHPTIPYVKEAAGAHIITSGKIEMTWGWDERDAITQQNLDDFWSLISSSCDASGFELVRSSAEEQVFIVSATFPTGVDQWSEFPLQWTLDTPKVTQRVTQDGTDIVCMIMTDGREGWTRQVIDLQPDETMEIDRQGDDTCFVVFGKRVMAGDKKLMALKPYKISSDSITVTNQQPVAVRVVRVYK